MMVLSCDKLTEVLGGALGFSAAIVDNEGLRITDEGVPVCSPTKGASQATRTMAITVALAGIHEYVRTLWPATSARIRVARCGGALMSR